MSSVGKVDDGVLRIDEGAVVQETAARLREVVAKDLRKRGLVVAVSGGVDSAVTAALSVEALGRGKVFGLLLPEQDSSPDSSRLGETLLRQLGVEFARQDIAPALEAIGCYRWRDEAISRAIPEYRSGWKSKIVIAGGKEGRINHFQLIVQPPDGPVQQKRLGSKEYLQIVAATNYKQRLRKAVEYFHADRLNYAVAGTPNRLEYDQGFFVKNGDGSADVKPIAHLYKTQVYALARHLGLPEGICRATPTTDTYSMPQGQDEFYFALPYRQMDILLWAANHGVPPAEAAGAAGVSEEEAENIYRDMDVKRRTTAYLHAKAFLLDDVPEIRSP